MVDAINEQLIVLISFYTCIYLSCCCWRQHYCHNYLLASLRENNIGNPGRKSETLMDLNIDILICLRCHLLYVSSIIQKGFIHGYDILPFLPATVTSSQRAPRELPESSQRASRELPERLFAEVVGNNLINKYA